MSDFTTPTKHLISFLDNQGKCTFILDPIDDVLRSEEVTKKLIDYLKLTLDSNVSFVLISSLIEGNILETYENLSIPVFSRDESIRFLTEYFDNEECSNFLEGFDYDTIAEYSGDNPRV